LSEKVIACIGPITARAARARGLPVHVEAGEHTIDGLVRALTEFFAKRAETGEVRYA
jgi:uroporphyrinogen III methyltransferase/synthase